MSSLISKQLMVTIDSAIQARNDGLPVSDPDSVKVAAATLFAKAKIAFVEHGLLLGKALWAVYAAVGSWDAVRDWYSTLPGKPINWRSAKSWSFKFAVHADCKANRDKHGQRIVEALPQEIAEQLSIAFDSGDVDLTDKVLKRAKAITTDLAAHENESGKELDEKLYRDRFKPVIKELLPRNSGNGKGGFADLVSRIHGIDLQSVTWDAVISASHDLADVFEDCLERIRADRQIPWTDEDHNHLGSAFSVISALTAELADSASSLLGREPENLAYLDHRKKRAEDFKRAREVKANATSASTEDAATG